MVGRVPALPSLDVSAATVTPRRRRRASSDHQKEMRREQILAAAKRVFAANGFHATTIADVARQAGVSYGIVYWYFDNKEALFRSLMDGEEQALRTHIGQSVLERALHPGDPDLTVTAIKQALRATLGFFESRPDSARILFRDSLSFSDNFARHLFDIYERFIGDIEAALVAAQEGGQVIQGPARIMAYSVAALVGQVTLRRLVTDDGLTTDQVADFLVEFILNGILAR